MSAPERMSQALTEVFRTRTADLARALDELHWDEFAAEDAPRAITMLFTAQGRALVSSDLLDRVVLAQLPALDATRAMLYPAGATQILLGDPAALDEVLVPQAGNFAVVPAGAVTARPVGGFGYGSGWFAVDPLDPEPFPRVGSGEQVWQAAAVGRNALTAELIGLCETALALVTDHLSRRGPDGRLTDADRLRLAGAHIELTGARDLLAAALAERSGWAASLAKARAGRAQAAIMRLLVVATGVVGSTGASDVRRFVERAACLDLLLGGQAELDERIGRTLLRGEVPFLPVVEI